MSIISCLIIMSSIRRKPRSGSSQGRGGNTQQEQTTLRKVNATMLLLETARHRMTSQQLSNSGLLDTEQMTMMTNFKKNEENTKPTIAAGNSCARSEGNREKMGKMLGDCFSGDDHLTASTFTVDGALEEVFSNYAPHEWEKQLVDIVQEFDDTRNRNLICAYKKVIKELQARLLRLECWCGRF